MQVLSDGHGERLRGHGNDEAKKDRTRKGKEHAKALPDSRFRKDIAISNCR